MPPAVAIQSTAHPLQFEDHAVARRVGLITLATDHTSEPDFHHLVSNGTIAVYGTRIAFENPTTPENLLKMQPELIRAAGLILPGEPLDVLVYSCTSASVVIGDDEVEKALKLAKPEAHAVTPAAAAIAGLKALDARRISILTPYTAETNHPVAGYFEDNGFRIDKFVCLGLADDRDMARISPEHLLTCAREATSEDSDALFISCTAVRAARIAAEIELAIGRPVVSSNLATAWAALRLCGDTASRPDRGTLMTLPYPRDQR